MCSLQKGSMMGDWKEGAVSVSGFEPRFISNALNIVKTAVLLPKRNEPNRRDDFSKYKLHLKYLIKTMRLSLPPFFVQKIISFFIQEIKMDIISDGNLYKNTEEEQWKNILTVQTLLGKYSEETWDNLMKSSDKQTDIHKKPEKYGYVVSVEIKEQGGVCLHVKIPGREKKE